MGYKLYTQTSDITVANTVTETSVLAIANGLGTLTLPANSWYVGKVIRGAFHGSIATTGTPTLRLRLKLDAVTMLDTTAVSLSAISGTVDVSGTFTLICRTTGASGTVMADVAFAYYSSGGGGGVNALSTTPASTVVDTTQSDVLNLTVEWGTASASNTMSIQTMIVEVN
jgi:hypothetical protein